MQSPRLQDRVYAGRLLAQLLAPLAHNPSVLVLALSLGGAPVAFEIATALGAPLDVFVEGNLGVAGHEEGAKGAQPPAIQGATVILVDDGIATVASAQAAVGAVRMLRAAGVIVAAPVMSMDAYGLLASLADRCYCLAVPERFGRVGDHYVDFQELSEADVSHLLISARQSLSTRAPRERGS